MRKFIHQYKKLAVSRNLIFIFVYSLLGVSYSCKDLEYSMPRYNPATVYLAGSKKNAGDTSWSATYWKNGVPTSLTDGNVNSNLFGIYVNDSVTFVAGYEGSILKYWRNGFSIFVSDSSRGKAMAVANNAVYIAGWTQNAEAVYWRNDALTVVDSFAGANCIAISGNDTYVAGYKGGVDLTSMTLWKNGSKSNTIAGGGMINSIAIAGSDVYAAGVISPVTALISRACYWKNSTLFVLSGASAPGSANSICIYNNDVYVAGYETNVYGLKVAKYWKNSVPTTLTDGTHSQQAYSIVVFNGDVYVTTDGQTPNSSILWKNGKVVPPFDGTSNTFYAYGLFIK